MTADTIFSLETCDGNARAGSLVTAHGTIPTPVFMPVGTRATVKAVPQRDVKELGAHVILGNTYHLILKPGMEIIEKAGLESPWRETILPLCS